MTNRNKLIAVVILIGLAYAVGRYLQPNKVEVITETVIKEVEVIKRDIEIIKEKETRKDGTIVERETTRDKSTETRDKDQTDKSRSIVSNEKSQWRVRGDVGYSFRDKDNVYGGGFEKRYMGPVSLGMWLNNKEQAGFSASFEF